VVSPLLLADRADRAWRARCAFGNLGNRVTCGCLHCGVWRTRDAARVAKEAALQVTRRLRQRAKDRAAAAWRRSTQ